MHITIKKPELEAMIVKQLDSGRFSNVDELLTKALTALGKPMSSNPPKRLIDVLKDPRFAGSGLEIEREKDVPRDIDL